MDIKVLQEICFSKINNKTIRIWISNASQTKQYDGKYKLNLKIFPYLEGDKYSFGDGGVFTYNRSEEQLYRGNLKTKIDLKLAKSYDLALTSSLSDSGFNENQNLPSKFTLYENDANLLDVNDFPKISISNIFINESMLLVLWATTDTNKSLYRPVEQLRGLWIITNEIVRVETGKNSITNSSQDIEEIPYTNLIKKDSFIISLKESSNSIPANISSDYITTVSNYLPASREEGNMRIDYFFRLFSFNLDKNTLKQKVVDFINKKEGIVTNKKVFPYQTITNYQNKLEAIEFYLKDNIIQKSEDLKFYFKRD